MKLKHLPVLSLVWAATAPAADLAPNRLGPLLQKPLSSAAYRLGLDYEQAETEAEARIIQRRLHLTVGLPAQLEFGVALLDTQEPAVDHASKPLGGQAWLRWNMLQTSLLNASAMLQYQPGLASDESAYQASQDRTSFGLDLELMPWSWMTAAVYAGYSRRQDERFGPLSLGEETQAGVQPSFGTENLGVYGEASQRHLTAENSETEESRELFAREWQAGLYVGTESLQLKTFAMIPDTHRYFGTTGRGYGVSFQMILGDPNKSVADRRTQPVDTVQLTPEPEIKVLETNELDEFQLLEQKLKEEAQNQQETPAEKAEREIRQSLEAEKKLAAQKQIEEEKARREAFQVYQKRVREDEEAYIEYKDDVNEEINRYTLPDQDDLNWNGLTQ